MEEASAPFLKENSNQTENINSQNKEVCKENLFTKGKEFESNLYTQTETRRWTRKKLGELFCDIALLTSTFIVHLLTVGLSFSVGVYYVVFLQVFNHGNGLTAWIGSLNFAALCGSGPVASLLIKKIGCSRTIILGGLVSSCGLFASVFAVNIYMLLMSFGLVAGIGFGLCFTASISLISYSFDKWRVACMGISLSGVGFGTFLQPILANYLIDIYGWKGSLLITSSVNMHVCLAGMIIMLAQDTDDNANNYPTYEEDQDKVCDSSDKSIWMNTMYWAIHINTLLFCFGQSVIYTHIAAFAANVGFTPMQCSSFISIIGIANLIGRIVLGVFTQHPCVNVTVLYIVCYLTAGVWIIIYTFWASYVIMTISICLLGFTIAAFGPLLSEVVLQSVGVINFAKAYGFLMLSMAAGTLLGAPSAGWLYDVTGVYSNSFYLGGASFALSAIAVMVPLVFERLTRKKRPKMLPINLMENHLRNSNRFLTHYGSQPLIM